MAREAVVIQRHVALLRGINVGGNNIVAMSRLRTIFQTCGYKSVSTYGNVGNVFFETADKQAVITGRVEDVLQWELNFSVRVVVKSASEITAIAAAVPQDWSNNADTKTDILFLWPKYDYPEVSDLLCPKLGVDSVIYVPGALLWSVKRSKVSQSGMRNIIGTDLYKHVTIRNVNTMRKIAQKIMFRVD